MRRPIRLWRNTLAVLGLQWADEAPRGRGRPARRKLRYERLEERQLLTGSPTSVGVFSDTNTAILSQQVGLTAVVNSASGTPTGTVTFYAGSTSLGTANVNSEGARIWRILFATNLPLGTDDVTAVYSGDGTFAGSTSPDFDETVTRGPPL